MVKHVFVNISRLVHSAHFSINTTQPAQKRRKDVLKTSYFWSQRRLTLVSNGSRDDLFSKRRQDVFQETS